MRISSLLMVFGLTLSLVMSEKVSPLGSDTSVYCSWDVYNPLLRKSDIRRCTSDDEDWSLLNKISWDEIWACGTRVWKITSARWLNPPDCVVTCRPCVERAVDQGWSAMECFASKDGSDCKLKYAVNEGRFVVFKPRSRENKIHPLLRRARECILNPSTC